MTGSTDFDDLLGGDTPPPVVEPVVPKIPIAGSAADHPTVYADGCLFATRLGSNVRLTFFETILEARDSTHPGFKNRHVGTLVMPLDGYKSMMKYLIEDAAPFIDQDSSKEGSNGE